MNVLAVDTSSVSASIALAINGQLVAESLFNSNRTLSARIIPEIDRLTTAAGIALADIDLFAAAVGPGSFTGVRGGVATIQGLALATGKPCAGFSSLAMLAMNFTLSPLLICPMLDARKGEVYAALYDCSKPLPEARLADAVLSAGDMCARIRALTESAVIFIGDGSACYRQQIETVCGTQALFAPFTLQTPRAVHGIVLALQGERLSPELLLPTYLRASDAELTAQKKAVANLY